MRNMLRMIPLGLVPVLLGSVVALAGGGHAPCPHCQSTDGVLYKDVVEHRCKMVEDKKPIKKTVYECKEVPYCQHKAPKLFGSECCAECEGCARYKKVLVKKEVTCGEKCTTKCVIEEIVRKVPCCKTCQAEFEPANVIAADSLQEPVAAERPAVKPVTHASVKRSLRD